MTPPNAEQWFKQEVHAHDGQLKAWLRGLYPTLDAEDVVQESYWRIWKARLAHPIDSAKAFLFKTARNIALDNLRREQVSPLQAGYDSAASLVLDPSPDAAQVLLTHDLYLHVIDALAQLPENHRTVVVLHKLKGLSHEEIADELHLTTRTATKYCSLGLQRCAKILQSKGIDSFFS